MKTATFASLAIVATGLVVYSEGPAAASNDINHSTGMVISDTTALIAGSSVSNNILVHESAEANSGEFTKVAAKSKARKRLRLKAAKPRVRRKHKILRQQNQNSAAGDNGTFCGNADVFVMYEEDANGDPVPGTKEYGCTD